MSDALWLQAELFKDDENLSGPKFWGYIVCIDIPDAPSIKLRAGTDWQVIEKAKKWASDRGVALVFQQ